MAASKQQLVELLDREVLDPILSRSPDDFDSDRLKEEFEDLRTSTESQQQRFHKKYTSAEQVKNNYYSDLHSHASEKKDRQADDLGLRKMSAMNSTGSAKNSASDHRRTSEKG